MPNVQIFPDAESLARAAVEQFVRLARSGIEERGGFSLVLSGGHTPLTAYSLLASAEYVQQVEWGRVHCFWGDERCVPPDSPDNNYHNAREVLLAKIPLPEENIHRIPAELEPERAAEQYEEALLTFFSALPEDVERERAAFDLVFLGLGEDGHTASLFPNTPAVYEGTRWVKAQYIDQLAAWRITLTPAILNRAANVIFMVEGRSKADALQRSIYGSYQPERYPSQVIQPAEGRLTWMVDEQAASLF